MTAALAALSLWLAFRPATPLSQQDAEKAAGVRLESYCSQDRGSPCPGFVRALSQRQKDGWLIEYQGPIDQKEFLAFFVHDDGRIEISRFKDDAERAESDRQPQK